MGWAISLTILTQLVSTWKANKLWMMEITCYNARVKETPPTHPTHMCTPLLLAVMKCPKYTCNQKKNFQAFTKTSLSSTVKNTEVIIEALPYTLKVEFSHVTCFSQLKTRGRYVSVSGIFIRHCLMSHNPSFWEIRETFQFGVSTRLCPQMTAMCRSPAKWHWLRHKLDMNSCVEPLRF